MTFPEVAALYAELDPVYLNKAVWLTTPDDLVSVMKVTDARGTPLFVPSVYEGNAGSMFGHPVKVVAKMPEPNTQLLFGVY
jgi:HK97 family phage major capsid protein